MNRREFLRQVGMWSAGAAAATPVFRLAGRALAADAAPPVLAVARGADHAALAGRALARLGGLGRFVKPGDRVLIKPNIGWDRTPEQAATTNPLVVKSLVELALGAGAASVLVVDRPCNEARRCYASSGIQAAVESIGNARARCEFIDERKFVPVKIARGQSIQEWEFYKDALEADCYINVPIAKHHSLSGLTLGLKNVMGVIGGNRGQIHRGIGQRLADLATVIAPRLTVIDATRILLRNGPVGGRLEDVQKLDSLIAAADPVAADAYATTLFGFEPDKLDSTRAAAAMGLGEMDLKRVQVIEA